MKGNNKQNQKSKSNAQRSSRSKSYNRKPKDKEYDKSDFKSESSETEHKYNDPMWYAKNEAMLSDAASYSYNAPVGSSVPIVMSNTTYSTTSPTSVPSVLALRTLPTIGISKDAASPANLAANNIYSFVRYQNSGAKNYDQADLMLYLLAMDSIYSCWNWLKRMYGYMAVYSQYNKTMPSALGLADGINTTDSISGLADFRLFLNRTAAQISSFCVPAVMPYFIRHSWMYSNVYRDSDTNKAQMYMFVPAGFYQYNETDSQYGGQLVFKTLRRA